MNLSELLASAKAVAASNSKLVSNKNKAIQSQPKTDSVRERAAALLRQFNAIESAPVMTICKAQEVKPTAKKSKKTSKTTKAKRSVSRIPEIPESMGEYLDVHVCDYSDKSFVVYGETKPIKNVLKALGGRFNAFLRPNNSETCVPGWVFPIKCREAVEEAIS